MKDQIINHPQEDKLKKTKYMNLEDVFIDS